MGAICNEEGQEHNSERYLKMARAYEKELINAGRTENELPEEEI